MYVYGRMQLVALRDEIAMKSVENQRLKTLLNQVISSYQALQKQISTIRQHQLDQKQDKEALQTQVYFYFSPIIFHLYYTDMHRISSLTKIIKL